MSDSRVGRVLCIYIAPYFGGKGGGKEGNHPNLPITIQELLWAVATNGHFRAVEKMAASFHRSFQDLDIYLGSDQE